MNELKLTQEPPRAFQPDYLTNNWRQIQAAGNPHASDSKYIKINGGVATVFGGAIAVRFGPVPFPDGYYVIDRNNEFILEDVAKDPYFYRQAKDIDVLRLNLSICDGTPPIYKEEIAHIKDFLEFVRKTHGCENVMLLDDAIFVPSKPDLGIKTSCRLPVKGEGLILGVNLLKLAFIEMLRYDYVFLWKDNRPEFFHTPLMIGIEWTNCVLIAPYRRGW